MSHLSTVRGFRIINRLLRQTYQRGRVVAYSVLERLFGTLLSTNPEEPILKPKAIEVVQDVNDQLKDLHFDMDLLMNEVQFHVNTVLERVSSAEVVRTVALQKSRQLEALIDRMNLLSSESAFVDISSIDTTDAAVIDRANTTASIDADSGSVTLRRSKAGTKRHKFPNLRETLNINILEESNPIRRFVIPGSEVRNIFNDTLSSWQYQILSKRNNILTAEIDFHVDDMLGVFVNKICGRFPVDGEIKIFYSSDGLNWFSFGEAQRSEGVTICWHSSTVLVNFLRIQIVKDGPDGNTRFENEELNTFTFAIESLALFDTGYEYKSTYQTVPLSVADGQAIRQVSLDVDIDAQANTLIEFEMAAANITPLSFRPIVPTNLRDNAFSDRNVPDAIDFGKGFVERQPLVVGFSAADEDIGLLNPEEDGSSLLEALVFTDGKSRTNQLAVNSKHVDYKSLNHAVRTWRIDVVDLKLGPTDTIYNPTLHIGVDAWSRKSRDLVSEETVTETYIELIESEGVPLFRSVTETIDLGTATTTTIPTQRNVLQSSNIRLIPSAAAGAGGIFSSILSIIELGDKAPVLLVRLEIDQTTTKEFLIIPPAGTAFASGQTRVRIAGEGYFEISVDANNSRRAEVIRRISGEGKLVTGIDYTITVGNNEITGLVASVSGNQITLTTGVSGRVEIEYNSPLTSREVVNASSIRITDAAAPNAVFVLGQDFAFSNNKLFITQNTKVTKKVGSNFNPGPDTYPVKVSFSFEVSSAGLDEFSTWLHIRTKEPIEFKYAGLTLDEKAGESALLDSPTGLVDITDEKVISLVPGWHRLVVRSRTFTITKPDISAAIYKVIALRSVEGTPFLASGAFFNQQRAFIDPSTSIGKFEISRSRPQTDMSIFGFDTENNLYFNFHPSRDPRIFTFSPLAATALGDTSGLSAAEKLDADAELGKLPIIKYRLDYTRFPAATDPVTEVVFRAILTRGSATQGDVTPVMKRVKIKAV